MIKPNVFKFTDYKRLLRDHAKADRVKRGYLRELAEAAGCQRSYFSSVLHSKNHLTPDHACALAQFWKLSDDETDYFLTLVDWQRAGGPLLKERLHRRLQKLKQSLEDFSKRLERPAIELRTESEVTYYSSWIYSAIHILTSIPRFRIPTEIANHLNIPEKQVRDSLEILEQMGLVKPEGPNRWRHSSSSRHVKRGSALDSLHHNNWRQRAVLASQMAPESGVHFTSVTAMTEDAFAELRSLYLQLVDDCNLVAGPSDCEQLVCFSADLFLV